MNIILMSLLAGALGMGLGGAVTAVVGSKTDRMIGIFLSLAGGVMVSIVLIELVPEAIEYSNIWVASVGLGFGAVLVMLLNNIMDMVSKNVKPDSKLHETFAEFFHSEGIINAETKTKRPHELKLSAAHTDAHTETHLNGREITDRKKSMLRSGMIMLFAIALHNIPEGLAMGAAGYHDAALGLTLALMIGLHNIPEGMAISAPLISGGLSKLKTLVLVIVTGATTVVGAVAGVLIGGISDITLALSFAVAGGAMLYVVFGEILPQSIFTSKDRLPAVFALVGIVLGLVFTQL